ncbi:MAG: thermonuclease family protein [Chloroflexota bacterium]|nr:thermonuclease family protein [Chloroflexota bacterium]
MGRAGPRRPIGRVTDTYVVDGDSINCRINGRKQRVRLYAIDAPEAEQEGGAESTDTLGRMVYANAPLLIEIYAIDRYGRIVGLLYPERSGRDDSLNVRMVREGQAYAYTRFGGRELGVNEAQRRAQNARLGVWRRSRAGGERPWDFRRRSRKRGMGAYRSAFWIAVILALIIIARIAIDSW